MVTFGMRFLALVAAALLLGCPRPAPLVSTDPYALQGQVEFASRQVQASLDEVANAATVSLIDAETGFTAGTTRTNTRGVFLLSVLNGYRPTTGKVYILEAVKGLSDLGSGPNRVGAQAARVRTMVIWQNAGWTSLANALAGAPLMVNRSTTAIAAIASLRALPAASMSALIGSVRLESPETSPLPVTPDGFTASALNGVTSEEFHTVYGKVDELLARDLDPIANLSYAGGAYANSGNRQWQISDFRQGAKTNVAVAEAGYVQLGYAVPPAPVPRSANEEAYFAAQGMNNDAAGTLATDGTYLYVKAWSNYANSTANAHVLKRIGTGFNGTTRGQNYGLIGTAIGTSITAAYWGGHVYSPMGPNSQLTRLNVSTGALDTVNLPDAQLGRFTSSLSDGGATLLSGDGTYAYSLAESLGSGTDGFRVRVLNPADNFTLVRDVVLETSTSSYYTDGFWCDGIYVYPIEWTGTDARLRRYRLADGRLEAAWTFSQQPHGTAGERGYSTTDNNPIAGHYDWVNNKFWIGNLNNDYIHMIKGGTFQGTGTYVSPGFDTGKASRLRALSWSADVPTGTTLTFQMRSADTREGLDTVAWYGPTGTTDSYTTSGQAIHTLLSGKRWVQVKAVLSTTDTATRTPRLRWFKVLYQ